jgi:hypothetical protein
MINELPSPSPGSRRRKPVFRFDHPSIVLDELRSDGTMTLQTINRAAFCIKCTEVCFVEGKEVEVYERGARPLGTKQLQEIPGSRNDFRNRVLRRSSANETRLFRPCFICVSAQFLNIDNSLKMVKLLIKLLIRHLWDFIISLPVES